jgi:hypothetical protein
MNMWLLLKSEMEYNITPYLMLFSLTALYSIFDLFGFRFFPGSFLKIKNGGNSIYVIATYILIIKMWLERMKDKTDRFHILIPVRLFIVSIVRLLVVIIPFVFIVSYFFIIHILILNDINDFASRLITQFSIFFVLVSCYIVFREIYLNFRGSKKKHGSFIYFMIRILSILIALALIIVNIYLFNNRVGINEDLQLYAFGLILIYYSHREFLKRRTYLQESI